MGATARKFWELTTFSMALLLACACSLSSNPQAAKTRTASVSLNAVKAFKESIYPYVQKNCVACHAGSQIPNFVVGNPQTAAAMLMDYINLQSIPSSRLITMTKNDHCARAVCETNGTEMAALVKYFYDNGLKSDDSKGPDASNLFPRVTKAIPIPDTLPEGDSFQAFQIPIDNLIDDSTAIFQFEIQKFGDGYRMRFPRIVVGSFAVYVSGVYPIFNDTYDEVNSQWADVDTVINPKQAPPLLSTGRVIYSTGKASGNTIAFGFNQLKATDMLACRALSVFVADVKPVIVTGGTSKNKCLDCHRANSPSPLAFQDNPLQNPDGSALSDETLCLRMLMRSNLTDPGESAIIKNPYTGANGHPQILSQADMQNFLAWLQAERQ